MNFDSLLQLVNGIEATIVKEKPKYENGCLMLILPETVKPYWRVFETLIDPEDYDPTEKGFEDEPHVTIAYGFDPEITPHEAFIKSKLKSCSLKFGKLSLFENENYDVLKIDIISSDLRKIRKTVMENFDIDCKYPDYKPHVTLAYLKAGKGKKYIEKIKNPLKDKETFSDYFKYSSPNFDNSFFYALHDEDFYN